MFGESGSGKTVLLSSFYGATQQPQYLQKSLFNIVADDIGQGNRLLQNYLGMRDESRLPPPTQFAATSYSFSVKLKDSADRKARRTRPFDALRLVWHDYPGEWFEQDVSGPEEAKRRVDTFRSLLVSDVAVLLVDGQRLRDHAGEEERYLKSLLTNFRNGLLSLKDELLEDGRQLVQFPRIWVMALSKADLLPDMDVFGFRDLLIAKAGDDITLLREAMEGIVQGDDALAVGEDFLLLSSAKFEANRIEVTERIGVELILPLAAILPFERHVRWSQAKQIPGKVAENLLGGVGALGSNALAAALLGSKFRIPGPIGRIQSVVGLVLPGGMLNDAAGMAGAKLTAANAHALAKHDTLAATLTGFKLDLEKGEERHVLLRSRR
ncbi:ATP/GTP-binding protein [Gulosibacter molinativorax]|nr:ATP/GTP-binding protein [Gulosibacter molinativorax]